MGGGRGGVRAWSLSWKGSMPLKNIEWGEKKGELYPSKGEGAQPQKRPSKRGFKCGRGKGGKGKNGLNGRSPMAPKSLHVYDQSANGEGREWRLPNGWPVGGGEGEPAMVVVPYTYHEHSGGTKG